MQSDYVHVLTLRIRKRKVVAREQIRAWVSTRPGEIGRSLRQQIIAGIDTHPPVTLTHASSTGTARVSQLVSGNGVAARSRWIVKRWCNALPLAGTFKRGNGFRPGRIPAQTLHLCAVDAVVHATHGITVDIYGLS